MAGLQINPDATGDESNIEGQVGCAAAEHYKCCWSNDGDTSYLTETRETYNRDLYDLDDHTTEAGTITNVRVYVRCKYGTDVGYAKASIKSGGVPDDGSQKPLTSSWALYYDDWATPPEGGSWTWAKIDALQAGVSLKTGGVKREARCTQVYVGVTYTPPPPLGNKSAGMAAKMVGAGII